MITAPFDSQAYHLMVAVMANDEAAVDVELAKKPNVNWSDSKNMTSMHYAALNNNPAIIRKLAAAGAGASLQWLDEEQRTPLGVAAEKGHVEVAEEIIAAGATPAANPKENVMSLAAEGGHHEMAKLLLAAQFPVDFMPTASPSPLMIASYKNDVEMMKIFVAAKADINLQDYRNFTALHRAAGKNSYDAASYLVGLGADETKTNIYGQTPERVADEQGFTGITGMLAQVPDMRRAAAEHRASEEKARIEKLEKDFRETLDIFARGTRRAVTAPEQAQFKSRKKSL